MSSSATQGGQNEPRAAETDMRASVGQRGTRDISSLE